MVFEDTSEYDDILYLDPTLKHPRMANADRAKIFAPFAALSGYEDAIETKNVRRQNKPQLSEGELSELNADLSNIVKHSTITLNYFLYSPGPDGSGGTAEGFMVTATGIVESIEPAFQFLKLRTDEPENMPCQKISFDDIFGIKIEES